MSIHFTTNATLYLTSLFCGAPTIAHGIEAKSNNSYISTIAKIIQLVPYSMLFSYGCKLKVIDLLIHKIPEKNAIFWSDITFIGTTIFISALPIILKGLQILSEKYNLPTAKSILQYFEAILMTVVKVVNIAVVTISLIVSFSPDACPLWIVLYLILFLINCYATNKELKKQHLPHFDLAWV